MPRPRALLRPWPQLRYYSTRTSSDPSILQRELFRRVAQPVAVLTAHIPQPSTSEASGSLQSSFERSLEHNHGATLSSLTSISLSPPLVSFSLRLPSRLATYLSNSSSSTVSPSFRVYLLSPEQEDQARLFARQAPLPAPAIPSPETDWSIEPKFASKVFRELENGSGLLGWMDCKIVKTVNLWEIERNEAKENEGKPMKSQLFIAKVEKISLGENGTGKGSLVWIEQNYCAITP
ncbi:hypothetical protein JCM3765_001865 [Sporobolomyces pararoseus]